MERLKFTDEHGVTLYEVEITDEIIPAIGDTVWLPNYGSGLQIVGRHIAYDDEKDTIILQVSA